MKILRLFEEITSGEVIVYHRTQLNSPKGIQLTGYKPGGGNAYGHGVYCTYDLESQLNDRMRTAYGNVIIKNKVLSMDRFLIFDYDVSRLIYGKNYSLDSQLKLILGERYILAKNNLKIQNLINSMKKLKWTSTVAQFFCSLSWVMQQLRGVVFTGERDGRVLVSYDARNIEPIAYSIDDGKSWHGMVDKNVYNRKKNYLSLDTNYITIINKLNNAIRLDKNELIYVSTNLSKFIDYIDYNILYYILNNSINDKELIISLLRNNEFIKNLTYSMIKLILERYGSDDIIAYKLCSSKGFIDNLSFDIIKLFFKYLSDIGLEYEFPKILDIIDNCSLKNLDEKTIDLMFERISKNNNLCFSFAEKLINKFNDEIPSWLMKIILKYSPNIKNRIKNL